MKQMLILSQFAACTFETRGIAHMELVDSRLPSFVVQAANVQQLFVNHVKASATTGIRDTVWHVVIDG
jgi:hypothetical protein